jgi:hypothetical protein
MISQPNTRYQSLAEFFEGTKDLTKVEAYQLAQVEYGILFDWKAKIPSAENLHPPKKIEQLVNYFGDLKQLLAHLERGISSATGYKLQLIEEALKQWSHNAKRDSLPDANNHG